MASAGGGLLWRGASSCPPPTPIKPYLLSSLYYSSLPFPNKRLFSGSAPPLPAGSLEFDPATASAPTENLEKQEEQSQQKQQQNKKNRRMTIKRSVRITSDGKLDVSGRTVLEGVPDNVTVSSAASSGPVDGIFLGAQFAEPGSRHVVSLGTLREVRFLACFRFKLWWMSQKMGDQGRDVPAETQFLLLETKNDHRGSDGRDRDEDTHRHQITYTVFLPLVEGPFRACLQGSPRDELELCIESGDPNTTAASFTHSAFVGAAQSDPFAAITDAIRAVESHLKTFRQRTEKRLPPVVDYFGWCTWDAFYQDVDQDGVEAGLQTLAAGGAPPKFVIIDDGWQSVGLDQSEDGKEKPTLPRLTSIRENSKFQMKNIVGIAKEKYGLKYVYVWHAITGYWGGVRPGMEGMEEYDSRMQYPEISAGVESNEPGLKTDVLTVQGLGLVNPKKVDRFYNELHRYLALAGVDGVKVDVQCVLETLGAGLGGRVEVTRKYHQALDASVQKNFPDNGIIACMSHNTDALYCSKQTAVVRASDDFYPRDPISHTIHIASVAYNSIFLGEFMLPDWDMFHSLHPAAEYHASARAISGGPVYVSDAPGKHNFKLLRKLVLPDGSILRARLPGRPTRDCLFTDPARDGFSLLKIWNMNKYTGVLGVYNCQGAAWSATEKKNVFHHSEARALSCAVKSNDVHLISDATVDGEWNGDCVVYNHKNGDLVVLPHDAAIPVSLKVLEHEIFTISPIKTLAPGIRFAPIGLIDMFNSGGAVEELSYHVEAGVNLPELESGYSNESNGASLQLLENMNSFMAGRVCMKVKGCGRFSSYSSAKPRKCSVDSVEVEPSYDSSYGLFTIHLDSMPDNGSKVHVVVVEM